MTLINANMPKAASLIEDGIGANSPSVDGAIAIFDAIMVAVAELNSADLDMDMTQQAETMATQLMADTSLQPYLDETGADDLLPVISQLLEEADSAPISDQAVKLASPPAHHIHQLNDIFAAPLADEAAATKPTDQAKKANALEAEHALFQSTQTASRQPRGHYGKTKNPVQVLASLIRKTDNKSIDSQAIEFNQNALQHIDGTATVTEPSGLQKPDELSRPIELKAPDFKAPALRSWHPPLTPV
ncbi:MAG: hypothetical protein ISQ21_03390, partial [Alphaproteobacteria bacterium]|nr:hypothetical protein [Alphaproteobacteria bacterium]